MPKTRNRPRGTEFMGGGVNVLLERRGIASLHELRLVLATGYGWSWFRPRSTSSDDRVVVQWSRRFVPGPISERLKRCAMARWEQIDASSFFETSTSAAGRTEALRQQSTGLEIQDGLSLGIIIHPDCRVLRSSDSITTPGWPRTPPAPQVQPPQFRSRLPVLVWRAGTEPVCRILERSPQQIQPRPPLCRTGTSLV